MTPDSDTYVHILLNGLLWYVVFFGYPTYRFIRDARRRWGSFREWDQRTNLTVPRHLHSNIRVLPDQRSTR